MDEAISLEQVEELYRFLQGEVPDGIYYCKAPRLSERKAFTVIWFLQERLRIIPDQYERCCSCGTLYDTRCSGGVRRERYYCDSCF